MPSPEQSEFSPEDRDSAKLVVSYIRSGVPLGFCGQAIPKSYKFNPDSSKTTEFNCPQYPNSIKVEIANEPYDPNALYMDRPMDGGTSEAAKDITEAIMSCCYVCPVMTNARAAQEKALIALDNIVC
jgi:hypothetical protein